MKTNNQNFLNTLNDWGTILTDTYEKHNKIILQDTTKNIIFTSDDLIKPIVHKDNEEFYSETYNSKKTGYGFKLSVFTAINMSMYYEDSILIYFTTHITNTETNNTINKLNVLFDCDLEEITEEIQTHSIKIETNFLTEFLNRAIQSIGLLNDIIDASGCNTFKERIRTTIKNTEIEK